MLADSMGLGKTAQALWFSMLPQLPDRVKPRPILVVCPKGLKEKWKRECLKFTGMKAFVVDSPIYPKRVLYKPEVLIINYEMLEKWMPYIKKFNPQVVIGDEAHYIKNPTAQRSKAFARACKKAPHVILLSGTPATNNPAEIWFLLHILYPKRFPNFMTFVRKWCVVRKTPWGWDFKIAKKRKLPKLRRLLRRICMIRRLKSQVLKDLPPKIEEVVPIDLEKKSFDMYDLAVQNFKRWYHQYVRKNKKKDRINELAKLGYLRRLAAKLKMAAVEDWIENFLEQSDDKLILFAVHRSIVKRLHKKFKDSVYVDGSVTGRKRQIAIDKFNTDKNCRIFIGNIKAAGVGWDAIDCASVAFVEMSWTPAEHMQASDRAHGLGRGKKGRATNIWYLVARNTIEEMLCKINQSKQDTLSAMLDRKTVRLAIFDLLLQSTLEAA